MGLGSKFYSDRNCWLAADDSELFSNCKMESFQSSGPGGQKRNRKYSAVRLIHKPTNLTVEACESRSQLENRKKALKKLRIKIAVEVRGTDVVLDRKKISLSNKMYPLWVATLFDKLWQFKFSIRETAASLDLSTSALIKLIARDIHIWKIINNHREKLGLKRLTVNLN